MKQFKKTIYVIMALLPMLPIILFAITNFHNTEPSAFNKIGTMRVNDDGENVNIAFSSGSLGEQIIAPLLGTSELKGAYKAIARMSNWLYENTGIPVAYTLFTFGYAMYMFLVELTFMIINIIAFIPRKCGEFFGG